MQCDQAIYLWTEGEKEKRRRHTTHLEGLPHIPYAEHLDKLLLTADCWWLRGVQTSPVPRPFVSMYPACTQPAPSSCRFPRRAPEPP